MNRFEVQLKLAEGFLDLGMYHDAWEELDKLSPVARAHPDTLRIRLDILLALKRWESAVALGTGCCREWRNEEGFFLRTAEALMQLMNHGNALALLKSAPEHLHEKSEYHYAVARCAACQGRLSDANEALQNCFIRDKSYRERALREQDFKVIWDSFG